MERAAFLDALRTYQDLTMQLSEELSAARQALAIHIESARLERETLVQEFLDRVDLLVAKVSTGASKHAVRDDPEGTPTRGCREPRPRLCRLGGVGGERRRGPAPIEFVESDGSVAPVLSR